MKEMNTLEHHITVRATMIDLMVDDTVAYDVHAGRYFRSPLP